MKYGNKKRIQLLYRQQVNRKKEKDMNFIEMMLMLFIIAVLIFVSHFMD